MLCMASLVVSFCMTGLGTAEARTALSVLRDAGLASGVGPGMAIGAIRSSGVEAADGLRGEWSLDEDTRTGRFAQRSDFGVFRAADGFDGRDRWRQDRSGGVHALDGAFSRRRALTEAWLTRRAYLRPGAERAALGVVAEREESGRRFEVLTATPSGGTPVELWFDAGSHLLDRTVARMPLDTLTRSFADYRRVGAAMLPFRIVSKEGGSEDAVTIGQHVLATVPRAVFARPTPPEDTTLAAPTTVPAEADGDIVVDAWLNGQGPFAFILDTGGHAILTPATVAQLGLSAVGAGQSGGAGAGTLAQQDVRVAAMAIGGARFVEQHFYVIPLQYATVERGDRPPIAGLLGVELFERLAVRIDHRRRQLTLAPFAQSAALCEGHALTITFDDDMPLVDGRIDGVAGVVAIDTGNGSSTVVQGVWAAGHSLAGTMKRGLEAVSFGSGGESRNWVSHGHRLALGPLSLAGLEVRYAEDGKGAFSSVTEAANVGHQVLANFDVAFDFSRRRMCLAPAEPFPAPPFNRSGLALSKTAPDQFAVVQVVPGSPSAAAGLQVGDLVTAIDGRPATGLSGRDVAAAIRRPPGTPMRLAVLRGGTESDVVLTLQEPTPAR